MMRSHTTRSARNRSIPRSLQIRMSFDEILALTADVFSIYNILYCMKKYVIAPYTWWYNVVSCVDNLSHVAFHIPVYEKDTKGSRTKDPYANSSIKQRCQYPPPPYDVCGPKLDHVVYKAR